MTYAVIETGGKQYRVQAGETIEVELLAADVGSTVELDQVLMLGGDKVTVGRPTVPGARVVAEVQQHGRGEKVVVFKYKRKDRYQRKQGHRQSNTQLVIKEVLTGEPSTARTRRRARGA